MILQFAPVLVALNLLSVWSLESGGDFDSQLSSTNSELDDIIQDVQVGTTPTAVVAPAANTNLDRAISSMQAPEAEIQLPLPEISSGSSPDLSSSLPMPQQITKLQKNMKTGSFVQTKLRTAISERSQRLEEAKDLLHRELNVLEQETLLKLREVSRVHKLQANIARMREQAAEEDKLLEESKKRTAVAESGAEQSESLDGTASKELEWANQKAAAAHERLLHAQGVWQNEHQAQLAKIARLTNVIDQMHKEHGDDQSQGNHFQATSGALMKQITDIQAQIAATATSKQNADINVAQIIRKWQGCLKQLREQVAMNSQLSQQAKGGSEVQTQINDLAQQVKERDTQITDLQEQVDEMSMQASVGMGPTAGLRGVTSH